jgi:hypothetical protein
VDIQGSKFPPLCVALLLGNAELASKLLEFEGGIANLADCQLEQVPPLIFEWIEKGSIKELDLCGNMIQTLPIELRNLKKVKVNHNPLQTIPVEIRNARWGKIRRYLEQIAIRAAQWNIRKLLLVGEGGVGKSVRSFYDPFTLSDCLQTIVRCLEAKGKVDVALK